MPIADIRGHRHLATSFCYADFCATYSRASVRAGAGARGVRGVHGVHSGHDARYVRDACDDDCGCDGRSHSA